MILADVPDWAVGASIVLGALASLLAIALFIFKSRPAKFAWRKLASEPFTTWTNQTVGAIVAAQNAPMREEFGKLDRKVTSHMDAEEVRDQRNEQWRQDTETRMDTLATGQEEIRGTVAELTTEVRKLTPQEKS